MEYNPTTTSLCGGSYSDLSLAHLHPQNHSKWATTTATGERGLIDMAGVTMVANLHEEPSGETMDLQTVAGIMMAIISVGAQIIMMSALTHSPALLAVR